MWFVHNVLIKSMCFFSKAKSLRFVFVSHFFLLHVVNIKNIYKVTLFYALQCVVFSYQVLVLPPAILAFKLLGNIT